ncbi:MAG: glycosyltransferase [Candidatus Eisenbacteria bacterium]
MPRWLLYSHDALGLGHVRRALAIARAVLEGRADLTSLLLTCSNHIGALPVPAGLEYVKVPSTTKVGPEDYRPRTLRMEAGEFWAWRGSLVTELVRGFAPDLMLVDKTPTGLMDELVPALEHLHSRGCSRLILGWRDILDYPEAIEREWRRKETLAVIERWYDEIWIYGDPRVFDMREEYRMPAAIAKRVHYLGYLAPPLAIGSFREVRRTACPEGARLALVTVGGGEEGEHVVSAYLQAHAEGRFPEDLHALVVTGPLMPAAARHRLKQMESPRSRVVEFLPGLESLIAAADVVIGRAGYNTVCELLGAGTPAVLVPRVLHRGEQVIRANRLAQLERVQVLTEASLTPAALVHGVRCALEQGRHEMCAINVDGAAEIRRQTDRLLPMASVMTG